MGQEADSTGGRGERMSSARRAKCSALALPLTCGSTWGSPRALAAVAGLLAHAVTGSQARPGWGDGMPMTWVMPLGRRNVWLIWLKVYVPQSAQTYRVHPHNANLTEMPK